MSSEQIEGRIEFIIEQQAKFVEISPDSSAKAWKTPPTSGS
jgi:hypothetical protein